MKKKKIMAVILIVAVVAAGAIFGVSQAFAHDEPTPPSSPTTFIEKVAAIYEANTGTALDVEQLQAAIQEAQRQTCLENRISRLERLVEEGVITQEQADEWKAWLEDMPDIDFNGLQAHAGQFFGKMGLHSEGFAGFNGSRGFSGDCPYTTD